MRCACPRQSLQGCPSSRGAWSRCGETRGRTRARRSAFKGKRCTATLVARSQARNRNATALPSPNPSGPLLSPPLPPHSAHSSHLHLPHHLLHPRTAPLAPPSLPLDHFLPRSPADVRRALRAVGIIDQGSVFLWRFQGGDQTVCMFPSGLGCGFMNQRGGGGKLKQVQ